MPGLQASLTYDPTTWGSARPRALKGPVCRCIDIPYEAREEDDLPGRHCGADSRQDKLEAYLPSHLRKPIYAVLNSPERMSLAEDAGNNSLLYQSRQQASAQTPQRIPFDSQPVSQVRPIQ